MAHHPNLTPGSQDSAPPSSERPRSPMEEELSRPVARGPESDIAELFSKFEQNSGGTLTPQFAADLALDIVLNEIVEQACLATGATGAAVVLRRGDEYVCRASTGASAPALGARMDTSAGLSGLCIRTGGVQRCEDAQTDFRVDAEASRQLGVRSVMILPLADSGRILGILEVLSPRPGAFGDRDQRTLEVLARRALRNAERAEDPFLLRADAAPPPAAQSPAPPIPPTEAQDYARAVPTFGMLAATMQPEEEASRQKVDLATAVMGLLLLTGIIFISVLSSRRLGWTLATPSDEAKLHVRASSGAGVRSDSTNGVVQQGSSTEANAARVNSEHLVSDPPGPPVPNTAKQAGETSAAGLQVFENGREVFRLPAGVTAPKSANRVVSVSSTAAENSVIHRVDPVYPERARDQQIQGKVLLNIRIGPDGVVRSADAIEGQPLLARAALDAVKQWRFKPQPTDNLAERETQITLNFRLK